MPRCVGPLLVPASAAADLARSRCRRRRRPAARRRSSRRPGTPRATVADAVAAAARGPPGRGRRGRARLDAGLARPRPPRGDVPAGLEVPRGAGPGRAPSPTSPPTPATAAASCRRSSAPAPPPTWAWPDEHELAAFLVRPSTHGLPLQADRRAAPRRARHYTVDGRRGAARPAQRPGRRPRPLNGAERRELAARAGRARPRRARRRGRVRMSADRRRRRARAVFTAYGCCGVTDPVAELDRPRRLIRRHDLDPSTTAGRDLARPPRRPPLRPRQPALRRLLHARHAAAGRRAHRRPGARRRRAALGARPAWSPA